jgi:hypothetical protein
MASIVLATRTASLFALCGFAVVGCAADAAPTTSPAIGSTESTGTTQEPWDSQSGNPTHATHSYLTEYAIDQLKGSYPEVDTYRANLVDGANQELHELPISDAFKEQLRQEAGGTNWAADHPEVVWNRATASYAAGDKATAYWYVGVVMHWVEDMGVPAHAFHVIHQGTLSQADNFEILGLQRWSPLYDSLAADPSYAAPSDYVLWNGAWTKQDFQSNFPGVTYTTGFFPFLWPIFSNNKSKFVQEREGRSAVAAKYALHAAVVAFTNGVAQ